MAWEPRTVDILGEAVDVMARAVPEGLAEVEMPWREDVRLRTTVTLDGKDYRVAMLVNPGGRDERLRLGLVATAQPTKPKGRRK